MRLLIMGAPGAGKGTQGLVLADRLGVPHISTGDLFRSNAEDQTPMWQVASEYINKGEYVPDEVTNSMVDERLSREDAAGGFILDGYPRTGRQVEMLDEILRRADARLTAVIHLIVDEDELVARLSSRAAAGGRTDDTPSVIRQRQRTYREETAPLLDIYADRSLLLNVDGMSGPDVVAADIVAALEA